MYFEDIETEQQLSKSRSCGHSHALQSEFCDANLKISAKACLFFLHVATLHHIMMA